MTTTPTSSRRAPEGFYQDLQFDAQGNVQADGSPLNGVNFDTSGLAPKSPQNYFDAIQNRQYQSQDYSSGGAVSRLGTDNDGNLFAYVDTAARDSLGRTQQKSGIASIVNKSDGVKAIKLQGIKLDPNRTTRNTGEIKPTDEVFLRQEKDGLYFAEIKRGGNTIGYSYSEYQAPKNALGGVDAVQDNNRRRQGGNAQRGLGGSSNKLILGAG